MKLTDYMVGRVAYDSVQSLNACEQASLPGSFEQLDEPDRRAYIDTVYFLRTHTGASDQAVYADCLRRGFHLGRPVRFDKLERNEYRRFALMMAVVRSLC